MLLINNLATADSYTDALTLESPFGGRLVYVVANASVIARFRPLPMQSQAGPTAVGVDYGQEQVLTPQSSFIDKISGVQFRSAVAGQPGRIIATLSEPGDILPASGTPFTQTLAAGGGTTGVPSPPIGAIIGYGGTTDPAGWLICDGRAISRTTYADLFSVLSTAYGVGDGSTTFNIPDLRGRTPVGLGTHADVNTRGAADAVALANRRPAHNHNIRLKNVAGAAGNVGLQTTSGGDTTTETRTGLVGPVSGGASVPIYAAPFQVVNFIIATGV